MALRYGYFDSEIIGVDDEGMPIFDRAELSDLFALLFANLVSDGVLALPSTCFRVRAAGNGLNLELDPGFGMIKGHFCYNNEIDQLTVEAAPQKYSRIDRVVMRCNYLERMVEIIIKTGEEAARPVPPELIRPAAGDYYELCLAEIRLSAKQQVITQSSITDTRANSAVCGYITQLIDHLDTAVFFEQLNTFYQEFVDKSNASYEQFEKMALEAYQKFDTEIVSYINALKQDGTEAYNSMMDYFEKLSDASQKKYADFDTNIQNYIAALKEKGDTNLAEITQQLLEFRNVNEAEFLAWFERIKGIFGEDPGGNMQNQIDAITSRLSDVLEMLYTGMVAQKLGTSDGDYIVTSDGDPVLLNWPICGCNSK